MASIRIRNISFSYSNSEFTAWGFAFEAEPDFHANHPIEYWKAQLAFRGWSPAGSNVNALKQRLREIDITEVDLFLEDKLEKFRCEIEPQNAEPSVEREITPEDPLVLSQGEFQERFQELQQTQIRLPLTERVFDRNVAGQYPEAFLQKYFFNNEGEDTGAEPVELDGLYPSQRNKIQDFSTRNVLFCGVARGNVLVIGSRNNNLGQRRRIALNQPPVSAFSMEGQETRPLYSVYSVQGWLRSNNWYNIRAYENAGWPVIQSQDSRENELEEDRSTSRATLKHLQELLAELDQNRALLHSHSLEPRQNAARNADRSMAQIASDTLLEVQAEFNLARGRSYNENHLQRPRQLSNSDWDINGTWEIRSPEMERDFGISTDDNGEPKPYIMEIFTVYGTLRNCTEMQIHGRFDWGNHYGIFRFCEDTKPMRYSFDAKDEPCYRIPQWSYKWRGRQKSSGRDVIELGVDQKFFKMKFSSRGREVEGTWGGDDFGQYRFMGRRIDDGFAKTNMDIRAEWESLSRAAHGKENTRWNRGGL